MKHLSTLVASRPKMQAVNIDDMVRTAISKGYEKFVVEAMVERAAYETYTGVPKLHELLPPEIHRKVGRALMSSINGESGLHPAGFPSTYQFELKLMKNIGASLPEIRLDEFNTLAHQFLDANSKKLPQAETLKVHLSDKARGIASALRAFGQDDSEVTDKIRGNEPLMRNGLGENIISMINADQQVKEGAKVEPKPEAKKGFFSARLR